MKILIPADFTSISDYLLESAPYLSSNSHSELTCQHLVDLSKRNILYSELPILGMRPKGEEIEIGI